MTFLDLSLFVVVIVYFYEARCHSVALAVKTWFFFNVYFLFMLWAYACGDDVSMHTHAEARGSPSNPLVSCTCWYCSRMTFDSGGYLRFNTRKHTWVSSCSLLWVYCLYLTLAPAQKVSLDTGCFSDTFALRPIATLLLF